jgi:hypothetical protein
MHLTQHDQFTIQMNLDEGCLGNLLNNDIYMACLSRVSQHPESSYRVWQMLPGLIWPPVRAEFG